METRVRSEVSEQCAKKEDYNDKRKEPSNDKSVFNVDVVRSGGAIQVSQSWHRSFLPVPLQHVRSWKLALDRRSVTGRSVSWC